MILIVSSYVDTHVEAVCAHLNVMGEEYMRIDLGAFYFDFDLEYSASANGLDFSIRNRHNKKIVTATTAKKIWWRRVSSVYEHGTQVTAENADVIETGNFIKMLLEAMPPSSYPLGHPVLIRRAENKVLQHQIACKCGLILPEIVFSNSLSFLNEWITVHDEIVVKSLSLHSALKNGEEHSFYAVGCNGSDLQQKLGRCKDGALPLQTRIQRDFDVRLNILPNISCAFKISVEKLQGDEVDWRPTTMEHHHEILNVPSHIDLACRKMLQILEIPWGAFDFIVDRQGVWWFLECNPNGQWLWLQQKTNKDLAIYFAQQLTCRH